MHAMLTKNTPNNNTFLAFGVTCTTVIGKLGLRGVYIYVAIVGIT